MLLIDIDDRDEIDPSESCCIGVFNAKTGLRILIVINILTGVIIIGDTFFIPYTNVTFILCMVVGSMHILSSFLMFVGVLCYLPSLILIYIVIQLTFLLEISIFFFFFCITPFDPNNTGKWVIHTFTTINCNESQLYKEPVYLALVSLACCIYLFITFLFEIWLIRLSCQSYMYIRDEKQRRSLNT